MNEKEQAIDAEVVQPQQAVAIRDSGGPVGILRPAGSLDAIAEAFKQYQQVCERILNDDDYQTYEGKPRKKKSAWRKLATAFNVSTKVVSEQVERDASGRVMSALFTIQAYTPSRQWEAKGYCDVHEKCCAGAKGEKCHKAAWKGHYCCKVDCDGRRHWSHPDHDVISTAQTRATNRAIADLIGCGEVSAEELTDNGHSGPETAPGATVTPKPPSEPTPAQKAAGGPKPAKIPASPEQCKEKFIKNIDEAGARERSTQFLIDLAWLLPTEKMEDMDVKYAPRTKEEYIAFLAKLTAWAASGKAVKPYEPHYEGESPLPKAEEHIGMASAEPWYGFIIPVPHKGEKREEYLKHPETIGQLYEKRHGTDEESQAGRQRLWGFVNHYEARGRDFKGKHYPPSESDIKFREMLDQFADWFQKNHPEEEL